MVHPVVRVIPETGRRVLFVNSVFTQRIVGVSEEESNEILRALYRHVQRPEFQVRLHWSPDTIAFWDNRTCQHYASSDYFPARRVMTGSRSWATSRWVSQPDAHSSGPTRTTSLPKFLPCNIPRKRRRRIVQSVHDVLPVLQPTFGDPPGGVAFEIRVHLRDELGLDEPAHRQTLREHEPHEPRQPVRPLRSCRSIVWETNPHNGIRA